MNKVKWGIMGTANVARWGMIPGMKKAENCELYAIAGRSAEKAKAFQEQYGFKKAYGSYEELLQDPEVQAVYIPLPNDIHLKWGLKLFDRLLKHRRSQIREVLYFYMHS